MCYCHTHLSILYEFIWMQFQYNAYIYNLLPERQKKIWTWRTRKQNIKCDIRIDTSKQLKYFIVPSKGWKKNYFQFKVIYLNFWMQLSTKIFATVAVIIFWIIGEWWHAWGSQVADYNSNIIFNKDRFVFTQIYSSLGIDSTLIA